MGEHLVRAYKDGSDVEARTAMALGSLLAGMAFSSAGTSIVHALQYPIGAVTGTAHGLGNAVLLPAAVRFSLGVRRLEAGALARQLGVTAEGDDEAAEQLPGRLEALARAVGIPPSLRAIGVEEGQLPAIAEVACGIRRLVENSARPVDEAGLLDVLRDAFAGSPGASEEMEGR
jgi:alcohol dehydrogenase